MLMTHLPGGQELHSTSHLETVADEVLNRQRAFPQVLHGRGGGGEEEGVEEDERDINITNMTNLTYM